MNEINNVWLKKGYVDECVDSTLNLQQEIKKLKAEKNAILMAHFYQDDNIQEIADIIGDSLALAQQAVSVDADIILLAGVHFMGETVKILNMDKKVLVPDLNAGCSLADSCKPEAFKKFLAEHPDHKVVSYVNTSAEIKALTDVVCTSSNAVKIVQNFAPGEPLIFGPDRNLGSYVSKMTGREMLLWDGCCHVHDRFSKSKILKMKKKNPDAEILAHPECKAEVLDIADYVGSTAGIIEYVQSSNSNKFIIVTESGILYKLQADIPTKIFLPAEPENSDFKCNKCEFMRYNTLEKIYLTLKYEWPEVKVENDLAIRAKKSIDRMLTMS